jgi:hypothetical protein
MAHLDLCKIGHRSKAFKRKTTGNDKNNNLLDDEIEDDNSCEEN